MIEPVTTLDACERLAAWGSYINASDPGVVGYSLRLDGLPDDETHREEILTYLREHEASAEGDNLDDLTELLDYFEHCHTHADSWVRG